MKIMLRLVPDVKQDLRFLLSSSSMDEATVAKEQQRRVDLPLSGDCMWSKRFSA